MKVNYLISIFIILMLNKINAINCASIDEHVQSLKDNHIIILDNNSHIIIFFNANNDKKYALIKEIPAYLSYVRCEDNIIYFSTITKNNVTYISNLFQNSSIKQEIINVINTNLTGYTDYLNNKYNLQLPIYDKNKLRKYLQQRSNINLFEELDTADSKLVEGLLDDDSEIRHIIPNYHSLWEDISPSTPDNTLLEGISPSTPDNTSTKDRVKEIQWSQTEDALIPDDSSKFIEDYADHKYTNTNDINTRFKFIKNVSSNDGDLRFIKEQINELKHGKQIIIQILDQIDFIHDNILAFKIKLNTPHHNEHAPYYDIDLFKHSKIIYSVKHVKIDVNITHNSTNMLILDNDSADNIMFDAANIYIAKDTTIQQPLNEDLKLDPTTKPETNSHKRPANLISEQPPVKKIKTDSTNQSTHSLNETVDNHSQNYDHINSCSTSTRYSREQISNEVKLNYSEFYNPYSMNDYFDVNEQPFKYIGEFNHTKPDADNITNELKKLQFGEEIRMKLLRPFHKFKNYYHYFAVRIRLKSIFKNHRYYDLDLFNYENLENNHKDNDLQMFKVSSECNSINLNTSNASIKIRINQNTNQPFFTSFTKTKLYISDQSSKPSNEKQNVPIDDPTYYDLYKIKSETQIKEILSFTENYKKIKTPTQNIVQNSQLIKSLSRLDSLNEDTLKLPYSNSIDEINPHKNLLTKEITLNENKITTDQLTNYSEFFNIYSDNDYFDVKGMPFKYIKEIENNDKDVSDIREILNNLIPGQELRMKLLQRYRYKDYYFALRISYINTGISRNYNVEVYKYLDLKYFRKYDNVKPFIYSFSNATITIIKIKGKDSFQIRLNAELNRSYKTNIVPTKNISCKSAKIYIYDPLSMSNEQIQPVIDHHEPIEINVLMLKFTRQVSEILSYSY